MAHPDIELLNTVYSAVPAVDLPKSGGGLARFVDEGDVMQKPVSLYTNTSGSASAITLSQSAANFDILEIFYCDIEGNYSSVRVWSPNNKVVSLTTSGVAGSPLNFTSWTRRIKISGTSITGQTVNTYSVGLVNITNAGVISVTSDAYIKIVKVLGWKV